MEAERRKANVRFARYCLKEVLFLYRGLRDQVSLAVAILSADTLGALREAAERSGHGSGRAISSHYSDSEYGWEAGPAELETAYAEMRPTLAEWAEAFQSYWNGLEANRRERRKLRRLPDSSPDKQELLRALSEKNRIEREREFLIGGQKVKGGQLQFAFLTLSIAAASLPDLREQFLRATDWELGEIVRRYHEVLHEDDRERLKLKLIHSIARDFSTWERVANSAHDLGTRAGCLAALADEALPLSMLPFVRKHWGREEVDAVLASGWREMKRVILGWRTRLDQAPKESPGLSATPVQQALDLELIGLLKKASGWADLALALSQAREKAVMEIDRKRGTPQKEFCARAFFAARNGGLADLGDARGVDLRGVDVPFRPGFGELRGIFDHANMSNGRFDSKSWMALGHVLFAGSYRQVDFTQSLFAGILLDGDFRGANLDGASFHDCRIGPHANFNGVDLSKTRSVPSRERVIRHGTFRGAKLGSLGNKVFADKSQVAGAEIPKSARGGVLTGRRFAGMEAFSLFNPDQHDSIDLMKRPPSWGNLCFDAPDTVIKTRAPIGIYDRSRMDVRGTAVSVLNACSLQGASVACWGQTLRIRQSDIRGAVILAPLAQDVIFCPQTTLANPGTRFALPKVCRVWAEVAGRVPAAISGPS